MRWLRGSHRRDQEDTSQTADIRAHIPLFAAGSAIIALTLFAYHALTWTSFTSAFKVCAQPFCDFVDYYYPMGEAIFRTGLPVDGFLYSPFIAILLSVFPLAGLDASLVVWGILQGLAVILSVVLFRRLVPAPLPVQLLFVALLLSSYPIALNTAGGQVSVFILAALFGMFLLYVRGRYATAAVLFAFAVSFKFYPLLFLGLFAGRRDMRFFLFAVGACIVALLLIPGAFLGIGDTVAFYGALVDAFRNSEWVVENPHSGFLPHILLRFLSPLGPGVEASLPLLWGISFALAAVNIGLIILIQRARLPHANLWSFLILFLTIPFVLKTSWPHDFFYLPFAQALLAWRLLFGEQPVSSQADSLRWDSWWKRVDPRRKSIVMVLLLPSIIFSNIVFFNLFGNFSLYGGIGFLFWSNLFLLIAAYIEFLPSALKQSRAND